MPTGIGGEVGWWCPSLDDSGNGTTTLNDLAGSSTGTFAGGLTSGAWTADTTAGGVRAIALASGGYVDIPFTAMNSQSIVTMSAWMKRAASNSEMLITQCITASLNITGLEMYSDGNFYANFGSTAGWGYKVVSCPGTDWVHLLIQIDGTATGNDRLRIWADGVEKIGVQSGTYGTTVNDYSGYDLEIGRIQYFGGPQGRVSTGRFDDVRVFQRVLTSEEKTALASMRGYQPATGIKRPRINGSLINSGLCRSSI